MREYGVVFATLVMLWTLGCDSETTTASHAAMQEASRAKPTIPASAPTPSSTGGFDGSRAYEHVRHLVAIGPRPPGSEGIQAAQSYIITQLKSYGCPVEE